MTTAIPLSEEPVILSDKPTKSCRYTYSKMKDGCLKFVIVDVVDSEEEWSEQESGEVRWYAFEPAPIERRTVRQYIESGLTLTGWTQIVELTDCT